MKSKDASGHPPPSERPFRVLLIAGSDRRQYNCPGFDGKARALMLRMAERLPPEWEIDYEDLGNVYGRARIQSCYACVSTSMALCGKTQSGRISSRPSAKSLKDGSAPNVGSDPVSASHEVPSGRFSRFAMRIKKGSG